jgi:hypothetical protein
MVNIERVVEFRSPANGFRILSGDKRDVADATLDSAAFGRAVGVRRSAVDWTTYHLAIRARIGASCMRRIEASDTKRPGNETIAKNIPPATDSGPVSIATEAQGSDSK